MTVVSGDLSLGTPSHTAQKPKRQPIDKTAEQKVEWMISELATWFIMDIGLILHAH